MAVTSRPAHRARRAQTHSGVKQGELVWRWGSEVTDSVVMSSTSLTHQSCVQVSFYLLRKML